MAAAVADIVRAARQGTARRRHDVVRTRRDAAAGEEDPGAAGGAPDLAGSMPGDLVAAVLERALQAELTTYLEYDRAAYLPCPCLTKARRRSVCFTLGTAGQCDSP
jgi:hypothetical protein